MTKPQPSEEEYCVSRSHVPSSICEDLAQYTRDNVEMAQMLIGPMEASVLSLLLRTIKARRVLEFGTYTGYSALAMAENLPSDGEVITLDINPETVRIAREYWSRSEHGRKIRAVLGPASDTMKQLEGQFDFVFIDADKVNYPSYVEFALERLSPGGIIALDNMLQAGRVLDDDDDSPPVVTIRNVAEQLVARDDYHVTLLPVRDGIMVAHKKP